MNAIRFSFLLLIATAPQICFADTAPPFEERVRLWKGESVTFVSHYCDPMSALTPEVTGKAGLIVDSRWENGALRVEVERTDTHERIVLTTVGCLAFAAETDALMAFVGRKLWTKGFLWDAAGSLPPTTELVAREVRVGTDHSVLALVMDTQEGRKVSITFRVPVRPCVLTTFCARPQDRPWSADNEFFEKEPRSVHSNWSADTWSLVRQGTVAVGMTADMVKAACGRYLTETGAVLAESGKASPTYTCNSYDFTMTAGKVTQSRKRSS